MYHEVGELVRVPQCMLTNERGLKANPKPTPAIFLGKAGSILKRVMWNDDDVAVLIEGEVWVVDQIYIQEWRDKC